jgi:Ca2+-binding RTX toxin-like protein
MSNQTGNSQDNTINGSNDDDVIKGLGGDDYLHGGGGNDVVHGGSGNDVIFGDGGNDKIFGEGGNDVVVLWSGHDVIDGGSGVDLLDFYNVTKGINIDLADGEITFKLTSGHGTATFTNTEGLYGSHYGDVIDGNGRDNWLFAMEGDDSVHGGGGDDVINGYKGNDKLFGDGGDDIFIMAPGKDTIDGGAGLDALDFYFAKSGVKVSLEEGSVSFTQVAGQGSAKFSGVECLVGSAHRDRLAGDGVANILNGREGDDTLSGLDGQDFLAGREGNDILVGGAGKDAFLFDIAPSAGKSFDTVTDFTADLDRLAFDSAVFDVDGTGRTRHFGNVNYQRIAVGQFQAGDGQVAKSEDVRIIYDQHNGILYYDSNGSEDGGLVQVADIGKHLDISAASVFAYHL